MRLMSPIANLWQMSTKKRQSGGAMRVDTDDLIEVLDRVLEADTNDLRELMELAGLRDLRGADLRGADLRDQDLQEIDFQGADLTEADLRGAKLQRASLRSARVARAQFDGADLAHTNLIGVDLSQTDFSRSKNLEKVLTTASVMMSRHVEGEHATISSLLSQALVNEAAKIAAGAIDPERLKRGIDAAVEAVIKDLQSRSKPVKTFEDIVRVASISAKGDRDIGNILASAMKEAGKAGVITLEEAKGLTTELEIVPGMQFDGGYLSPYFATNTEKMLAEFEDPYILLHEQKLSNVQAMLPMLEEVVKSGKPLVIIAEDVEGEVLATLVVNKLRGGLKVAAVKVPGSNERRKAVLEDIAILTGGKLISEDVGIKLENITLEMLGRAQKIIGTKEETTIVGGAGKKADIQSRCTQIRREIKRMTSGHDREKLQERLARLAGGVAVVRVGGATELEAKVRKDLVEDALDSTRAAVEEGILPGGEVTLLDCIEALGRLKSGDADEQMGIDMVRRAIEGISWGFAGQKRGHTDLVEAEVIDPTKIVRLALQNAASAVGRQIGAEGMGH